MEECSQLSTVTEETITIDETTVAEDVKIVQKTTDIKENRVVEETVAVPFEDVKIIGIDKEKTVHNMGLFQLHVILSNVPEKFWMGCFEQAKNEPAENKINFMINNGICIITVSKESAQTYIDSLKKVLSNANDLFREHMAEVEMEKQRLKQELLDNIRLIDELHSTLEV